MEWLRLTKDDKNTDPKLRTFPHRSDPLMHGAVLPVTILVRLHVAEVRVFEDGFVHV
jgi:hypothetical protein